MAVVPAEPGGRKITVDLMGAVKRASLVDSVDANCSSGESHVPSEAEEPVPVEWAWLVLRKARMESYCIRLVAYLAFTAIFTVIFSMIRPVSSTFAVQDTLVEQITRRDPQGRTFYDISNDAEWFDWVEQTFLPTALSTTFFNGDPRASAWGSRFINTVSMYNTQTAPIRFRQARVTDDSCDTPAGNSNLARPCWGHFSTKTQSKQAFGEEYGNRYLKSLERLGKYGTEAHVVDVALNKHLALNILQRMKQGLFLNEQTRVVAIETSWYNSNLDLSTYVRWQLEITPGGRFHPTVAVHSCRLNPYATTADKVRLVLEIVFAWMVIFYITDVMFDIRAARQAYFYSVWNWLELLNLVMYLLVMGWWLAYLTADKDPFKVLSADTHNARPDISKIASDFDSLSSFAAFNVCFSYVKAFKYMQIHPMMSLLWRTISMAAIDMCPFLVVFLIFTAGFAFAAHWMFGLMMVQFHTWARSFVTLFLTLVGGFPYDEMRRIAPVSSVIFTIAWVLIMVMILSNMFVAILAEWYYRVNEDHVIEHAKISKACGHSVLAQPARHMLRQLASRCRGRSPVLGGKAADAQRAARELRQMLKGADLRDVEYVRKALVEGQKLAAVDFARHFKGNVYLAYDFAQKLRDLAEANTAQRAGAGGFAAEKDDQEAMEQDQVRELQRTVERLEAHLKQLRGALHASGVAPLAEGQSAEGYMVKSALWYSGEQHLQGNELVLPNVVPTIN